MTRFVLAASVQSLCLLRSTGAFLYSALSSFYSDVDDLLTASPKSLTVRGLSRWLWGVLSPLLQLLHWLSDRSMFSGSASRSFSVISFMTRLSRAAFVEWCSFSSSILFWLGGRKFVSSLLSVDRFLRLQVLISIFKSQKTFVPTLSSCSNALPSHSPIRLQFGAWVSWSTSPETHP